jgi:guanylate kinase
MRYYDYAVENDTVENAVQKVLGIIQSEHLKVSRILDTICADERE